MALWPSATFVSECWGSEEEEEEEGRRESERRFYTKVTTQCPTQVKPCE